MIVRIVKMTFREDKIDEVKGFLSRVRNQIESAPGCRSLDILQDSLDHGIFFSHSIWRSETDLFNYRNSAFFKQTWSTVKKWFSEKPEAWSLNPLT